MQTETFAADQIGFPILTALIVLPVAGALVMALVKNDANARRLAAMFAAAELLLSLLMAFGFVPGVAGMQYVERAAWMPSLGVGYTVGVDGISMLFVPLTALLAFLVLVNSADGARFRPQLFCASILLLTAATIGIFVALDLILFYVFYELALIPAFLLITMWGSGPHREHAGGKYILYMLCGSVPLLLGFILLAADHRSATGVLSFDYLQLLGTPVSTQAQALIFLLLVTGFAVKGPLLPFHSWMPSVVSEGPVSAAIFLVGLKLGAYGILRFVLPLLPDVSVEYYWVMCILGLAAMLFAALVAITQHNLRRLLAFASISHVGLVFVGLFSLNAQGLQGGLLMLLAMGVTATGLLFLAGALQTRLGSSDVSAFGGLARDLPRLATMFFLLGLASIGMPGTIGFTGEFLVLMGAFNAHWALAAVGVLGVILSAGYFLKYYERAFFGPARSSTATKVSDLSFRETMVAASLVGLILWGGLYPAKLLEITAPSINLVLSRIEAVPRLPAQASIIDHKAKASN